MTPQPLAYTVHFPTNLCSSGCSFTVIHLIYFTRSRIPHSQLLLHPNPIRFCFVSNNFWVQSLLHNFARLLVATGLMVSQFLIASFLQIKYSLHPFLYIRKNGSVIPNFANAIQEWLIHSTSLMRIHLKFVFCNLIFVVSIAVHSTLLWSSFVRNNMVLRRPF